MKNLVIYLYDSLSRSPHIIKAWVCSSFEWSLLLSVHNRRFFLYSPLRASRSALRALTVQNCLLCRLTDQLKQTTVVLVSPITQRFIWHSYLTRSYAQRSKRYSNNCLLFPSTTNGNFADPYIRLARIFCPFQMVTFLTYGDVMLWYG